MLWEARRIHRIPEEELQCAPTITEALPKFLEFAQHSILVAHNAEFDMSFLETEKEFCWGYVEIPECLCTMCLSKAVFPHETCHTLDAVSRRLRLHPPDTRHRALSDALLTAETFLQLLQRGALRSLEELRAKANPKPVPCR
jgi:DNA polymerase III epsilon subunit-like protein